MLLSGTFPSINEDNTKDLKFNGSHWDFVSVQAKDFLRKGLAYDHSERWSCKELLEHEWLKGVWVDRFKLAI